MFAFFFRVHTAQKNKPAPGVIVFRIFPGKQAGQSCAGALEFLHDREKRFNLRQDRSKVGIVPGAQLMNGMQPHFELTKVRGAITDKFCGLHRIRRLRK